jgi:putative Ca2+/H+ antiporter (TMEM165/GDT1 family)
MGLALPQLLPKAYTHFASAILFAYFGIRLLKDAYEMEGSGPSDELHEVEEELIKKKENDEHSTPNDDDCDLEKDNKKSSISSSSSSSSSSSTSNSFCLSTENLRVFTQALTLTFLAEWGDRSQIATIALAAAKNPYGVIIGGLIGHAFCTGLAVIGGRMLAAKISERHVASVGGVLFLVFAIHSLLVGPETNTVAIAAANVATAVGVPASLSGAANAAGALLGAATTTR